MAEYGDILHRLPQSKSVDAVRWLSSVSAFDRFVASAVHDPDAAVPAAASAIEIHSLILTPSSDSSSREHPCLHLRSSWPSSSRISALRSSPTPYKHLAVAASTLSGSLHVLFVDPVDGSIESELSTPNDRSLHAGVVSAIDLLEGGRECVTAGEDGRVNLASIGESKMDYRRVYDSRGLASYTAVRWASPVEFATGGLGFGVQWWDPRKPGGFVSQFTSNWAQGKAAGIVHSIDIHPSRKHICMVGGSAGTVFAWDLRYPQQPILLSGAGGPELLSDIDEVWEVQYDSHTLSSSVNSATSAKLLPVMMCSEEGILAVLEQGEEPKRLLQEYCAINSFDIDPQNPSDIVCALEWEAVGILMRPKAGNYASSFSRLPPSFH
ncbi:nuclear pore complex protein NUP43 [Curcuma longa]|uniref:nuclear pore complex protein NUP43 n=1 Tax=Curcuma longa TaxID=136217 RepID=UPI003D9E9325